MNRVSRILAVVFTALVCLLSFSPAASATPTSVTIDLNPTLYGQLTSDGERITAASPATSTGSFFTFLVSGGTANEFSVSGGLDFSGPLNGDLTELAYNLNTDTVSGDLTNINGTVLFSGTLFTISGENLVITAALADELNALDSGIPTSISGEVFASIAPEPASMILFGTGLLGIGLVMRKRLFA